MLLSVILASILITAIILLVLRLWLNQLERTMGKSSELVEWLKDVGSRVETNSQRMDQKLSQNMQMFNNRLDTAAHVIGQVQKSIGEFSEIGRSMQELQQFLSSPKLRGNIGEQILKELLAQYFPPETYSLQYSFKTGDRVDAVIKTSQGIIPIDSKFPAENYRKMIDTTSDERQKYKKLFEQDVKRHIHDIARKYLLVSEGTVDYAIMYIPSEAVYYEILTNQDLLDFASSKRVLPVSPMCFYAYMKAILMSFEGARIQSQTKEILSILQSIKKDYEKTDESLAVLTKHVTNAYNQTNIVSKTFMSLGHKLSSTHLLPKEPAEEKLFAD